MRILPGSVLAVVLTLARLLHQPPAAVGVPIGDSATTSGSQITVASLAGNSHRVSFSPASATVGQLRARVAELEGARLDDVRLVFAGKQLEGEQRLLSDLGVQADSRVIFVPRPRLERLTVKTITGESLQVPVSRNMTVRLLKCAIELFKGENVPAGRQQLTFRGAVLDDDQRTLGECGLRDDSELTLAIGTRAGGWRRASVSGEGADLGEMEGAERARYLTEVLVAQYNERLPKFEFRHSAQLARLEIVQALVQKRVGQLLSAEQRDQAPIWREIFDAEELRVEFSYVFRDGRRLATLANLSQGAEWVADQAHAALEAARE